MKKLKINIKEHQKKYTIFVGSNIIEKIATLIDVSKYTKIAVITDMKVAQHWLEKVNNGLIKSVFNPKNMIDIIIESGEVHKNINTVQNIWEELYNNKIDRNSLVINLGGGVICDIGGFSASTHMRGVDFLQVPTTVLSQVDASVGGKTGIDFMGGKNTIGMFSQPIGVIIDIDTLDTLPKREFRSGWAEIIKHGLIADKNYLNFVTKKAPKKYSKSELIEVIKGSNDIKSEVVEQDERESGIRKILNFGHTAGHAIESLSLKTNEPLLHGEAVAIGMIVASKISNFLGNITNEEFSNIETKLNQAGLPTQMKRSKRGTKIYTYKSIKNKMISDKKNKGGKIMWTLLKSIGQADWDKQVNENLVRKAIDCVLN